MLILVWNSKTSILNWYNNVPFPYLITKGPVVLYLNFDFYFIILLRKFDCIAYQVD